MNNLNNEPFIKLVKLEAPKKMPPVIKTALYYVNYNGPRVEIEDSGYTNWADNLKLTFQDGELVSAEVIK